MPERKTFFISRAGADKRWAELIASVVRDAGHEAIYQDEHFRVGQSYIDNMSRASESDCTIAILSPAYFASEYCLSELNAALAADPLGRRGRIIPVRVEPAEIPSLAGHLAYLDLVGADDDFARQQLMTTLEKHGEVDCSKRAVTGGTRRLVEKANRNRSAMIEKVRAIWITGFLQQSLFHETRMMLGLSERPDAVTRPMDLLVKRPDQCERPLQSSTQVVDAFDSMDQAMLILGAPGSGKTTLLLELARDLLARAGDDPAHPIPVIFPLSTWTESRKPIGEWLVDELNLRYDIPRKIAQEWVASDQVLPLLDGLDEVKAERRAACVETINAFRQSHCFLPLVITSRTTDYEALAEPLRLHGAILVRPLTREQVNSYLTDLGPAGERVRAALREDSSLWELLDSPLLMNIVTVSYAGRTRTPAAIHGTIVERRDQLFGWYVDQMLRRRAAESRYAPAQTEHWLSWLACQMANRGQAVFYLEGLQIDWLPKRFRWAVRLYYGLVCSVFCGLICWMLWQLIIQLRGGDFFLVLVSVVELLILLIIGLVSMLDYTISPVEKLLWSWPGFRPNILIAGLLGGMLFGLVLGLESGLVYGLIVGLVLALLEGLTFGGIENKAVPNDGIRRSARNALFVTLPFGLLAGVFAGLLAVLHFGLHTLWLDGGVAKHLLVPLVALLLYGLVVVVFVGLVGGLQTGGAACLKHFVLRRRLILNGSMPWNYVRFLDYATERILLRKIGGGYAFLHRTLLEYFAARYVERSIGEVKHLKPTAIEDEL